MRTVTAITCALSASAILASCSPADSSVASHASIAVSPSPAAPPAEPLPFAWPPTAGASYPELALLGIDGETVRLEDFAGKVLLIEPIGMT